MTSIISMIGSANESFKMFGDNESFKIVIEAAILSIIILCILQTIYAVTFKIIKWKKKHFSSYIQSIRPFVFYLFNAITLLIFVYKIFGNSLNETVGDILLIIITALFGIIVIKTIKYAIFDYIIPRSGPNSLFNIYEQLGVGILYIVLLGVIINVQGGFDLTKFIATSAVASMILGLALQDTLGNIFAGLAINISKPYIPGDWIRLGDVEGKISAIDWRSISVETSDGYQIFVPHNQISKMNIINYSRPTKEFLKVLYINISNRYKPSLVISLITEALKALPGIKKHPAPSAGIADYGFSVIRYKIVYRLNDLSDSASVASSIMQRIWYTFKRKGINIWGDDSLYIDDTENSFKNTDFLKKLNFFSNATDEELDIISSSIRKSVYDNGENIHAHSDESNDIFLLYHGKINSIVTDETETVITSKALKPGWIFGEMPEQANYNVMYIAEGTVVILKIDREIFKVFLDAHKEVREIYKKYYQDWEEEFEEITKKNTCGDTVQCSSKKINPLTFFKEFFNY